MKKGEHKRMFSIGTIILVSEAIIIVYCIVGVIDIFVSDWRYCGKVESENFQRGRDMSKEELENEISMTRRMKIMPGQKLEIFSNRRGLESALREK